MFSLFLPALIRDVVPRRLVWFCDVGLTMQDLRGRTARRFTSRQRGHSAESRERHMKYDVRTSDFWWQFAKFAI